jgi:serine protease Do
MPLLHSLCRPALFIGLIWLALVQTSFARIPDLGIGRVPTLAPLVKEVTIGFFASFFDVPKQREKEINATGSGVIVDAQRGYVLTANHVVAQASLPQMQDKRRAEFCSCSGAVSS